MEGDYIRIYGVRNILYIANVDKTQLPSLLHYNDDGTETIPNIFIVSRSIRSKKKREKSSSLPPFDVKTIPGKYDKYTLLWIKDTTP